MSTVTVTPRAATGEAESPGAWLRGKRLARGYTTTDALAHKVGASLTQVCQWENNLASPQGERRIRALSNALGVTTQESVARLWGEKLGGKAPCGCGTLVFSNNPNARTLAVDIPCEGCGKKRPPYRQSKHKKTHRKLCNACALRKRTKYTCVGYHTYGKTANYGPRCPRSADLTPSQVKQRQGKWAHTWRQPPWFKKKGKSRKHPNVSWERSFIDEPSHIYRCNSCAKASFGFAMQKARLKELSGEEIRTKAQYRKLWFDYYEEFRPSFGVGKGQGAKHLEEVRKNTPKERIYNERHRENTSRGITMTRWYSPPKLSVSVCLDCDTFNYRPSGQPPAKFHGPCLRRLLEKGQSPADIRSHKPGPRVNFEENLKRYHSWAVRYCYFNESLRDIGTDSHCDWKWVEGRISYVATHLPMPDKVPRRLRKFVSLLREAAFKKGLL